MLCGSRCSLAMVGLIGLLVATACTPVERDSEPTAGSAIAESYLTAITDLRPVARPSGERLKVLATTSILADVVAQVGGDAISLTTLIPAGVDPHAFQPTPQEAQAIADADIVFLSGFGLEAFMSDLIEQAGGEAVVVSASLGIDPLSADDVHATHASGATAESAGEAHAVDPHTWFDPNNVAHWTENIEDALSAIDPQNADGYAANASRYRAELRALDEEIRQAVARIPPDQRKLVTDHEELAYFADEYGFEIIGSVLPGTSSLAEPSAQEMAALFDAIQAERVPAVFVIGSGSDAVAERLAEDAGVRLVRLYGHSLTAGDGPAASYLDLMRYNALAIAEALTP